MTTIFIDNKPYQVEEGQNLLHACLGLGFEIPHFCWHPALHSVGACRQCAVKIFKDEKDIRGKIVMSCMTPADDGVRISIDDPAVTEFRAGVIEWLMLNHPHDCPVCDEGGECHLQDMTLMTGHSYRRSRFPKRTFRNQDLGPFINHEMNRCIQCYRCVRFYRDHAGGRDFGVFGAHDHVYFGRHTDGALENPFSGNLVEVCPTGVFTDKTFKRHFTRLWDLQTAPSVCVHCGLGCNTIPGERYGSLRRIRNRYNGEVNGYFLCDRGRFGYEFVNSDLRIRQPLLRKEKGAKAEAADRETVLKHLGDSLFFGARVIGIGSARAGLEANFALRTLVGPENFHHGLSEQDRAVMAEITEVLKQGPARSASLRDAASCDAVLILGEDVLNTAPRLALALRQAVRRKPFEKAAGMHIPEWSDTTVRQAVQEEKGPLFIAAMSGTGIDDIATATYVASPEEIAVLGYLIAHKLDKDAPQPTGTHRDMPARAREVAEALRTARSPLIVSGTSCGSTAVVKAAANVAWALCRQGRDARLSFVVPECNSMGLSLLGGDGIESAIEAVVEGDADSVIVLETDLYRHAPADVLEGFFRAAKTVIAIDHLKSETVERADIVLPCATFAESDATVVSSEGRAQRSYKVFPSSEGVIESWRWCREMMALAGRPDAEEWSTIDDLHRSLAVEMPAVCAIVNAAPAADFRISGRKVARQSHRFSGRTSMTADLGVREPRPADDPDSPLAFSMEGYQTEGKRGPVPPTLISRFWAPGWNSVQAVHFYQKEIGGALRGGDPGVRLFGPHESPAGDYFPVGKKGPGLHHGEWLIVPLFHVFGSEELSMHSTGVASRAPQLYISLNPEDAGALSVSEGDGVRLTIDGKTYRLPVRYSSSLRRDMAGLPSGLPALRGILLPCRGVIQRAEEGEMADG